VVVVVVVKVSCMIRTFHFSRKAKVGACSDGKGQGSLDGGREEAILNSFLQNNDGKAGLILASWS